MAKTQQLSLEQQFAIAKMNRTIERATNHQLKNLVCELFIQNIHLTNEIKRIYMEDL